MYSFRTDVDIPVEYKGLRLYPGQLEMEYGPVVRGVFIEGGYDPKAIFTCGQCFRWSVDEYGLWRGVVGLRTRLVKDVVFLGGAIKTLFISCQNKQELDEMLHYLDFGTDYTAICNMVVGDERLVKAAEFGKGIRILNQDPFETLISFIISQQNNIPRISKIIERMSEAFGTEACEPLRFGYAFPSVDALASARIESLESLGLGYRAKYVWSAAKRVQEEGIGVLNSYKNKAYEETMDYLLSYYGIGDKVASCVALFGLGHKEAFPIDVWIRRVLESWYDGNFDPHKYDPYAGVIQQYMYYFGRENAIL